MMRELTEADFARGVKNPHFDKIMKKIEIAIRKEDWNTLCDLSKLNSIPPEIIIRNCIASLAKEIRKEC